MKLTRNAAVLAAIFGAVMALGSNISVTEPTANDFLGLNNSVSFNITNAVQKVTVRARATQVADPTIQIEVQNDFTPNTDGKVSGTLNLNFTSGFPNGAYTLVVTATEPGAVFNIVPPIPVTVDVQPPKFLSFNPQTNGFVRDNVFISALFQETNMKEWRVKVAGADIPNNTGTINTLGVTWNSNLELNDGQKNIVISAEDLAGNTVSQSVNVTLDRLPPSSTVLAPTANDRFFGNARVPVIVNIADQFSGALDERTIDVFIRDTSGNFVTRVARRSVNSNGSTLTWTGRIRDISTVPTTFDLVVAATDRAGNAATEQVVRIERNRSIVTMRGGVTPPPVTSETVRDKATMLRTGPIQFGLRRN
ncbi:hypothetical protein C0431_07950 [bacterium]|nr:hypothetical protein [bacterium]